MREPAIRALAYETLSVQPGLWHHGIVFCLPRHRAAMPGRCLVTELGPDCDAIRGEDRGATLFDLGIGAAAFDFCVRTREPALVRSLRRAGGLHLLDARHHLARVLVEASPHRIAVSRLARIEVYQRIAPSDGATPTGPHTHFIPRLLRLARTHSANIGVAPGWVPGLALHPPHPARDELGRAKPFAPAAHAAFQRLLARFGAPDARAAKAELLGAVRARRDAGPVAAASQPWRQAGVPHRAATAAAVGRALAGPRAVGGGARTRRGA